MKDIFKILEDVLEEESAAFESIPRPMTEVYVGKRLVFRTEDRETAVKTAMYYDGTIRDTVATKPMTLTVPVKRKDVLTKNDAVPAWIPNVQLAPYCNRITDISSSVKSLTSDHPYTTKGWLYGLEYIKIPAGSDIRSTFGPDCVAEVDDFEGIEVRYFRNVKKLTLHKIGFAKWKELMRYISAEKIEGSIPMEFSVIDGSHYCTDENGDLILAKGVADADGVLKVADGCVSIADNACAYNFKVLKLICPPSLRTIGDFAFCNSGLHEIQLNEGLNRLDRYALATEKPLDEVALPSTVTHLDYHCLHAKKIIVPKGVMYIHNSIGHRDSKVYLHDETAARLFFQMNKDYRSIKDSGEVDP